MPVCGADVIEKKTRKGHFFLTAAPLIPTATYDLGCAHPTRCAPSRGKSLFKKRGNVLVCLDEKCGFSKPAPKKKKNRQRNK